MLTSQPAEPRPTCVSGASRSAGLALRTLRIATFVCALAPHLASPGAALGQGSPDSLSLVDSVSRAAQATESPTIDSGAPTTATAGPVDTARTAAVPPPPPPMPPPPPPSPPATLSDLDAWLEYKAAVHALSLPLEARVFYRRALLAREAETAAEALRLMRGAAQLDPLFLEPRIALIGWLAFHDLPGAMAQAKSARDLVRRDFSAQWTLTANGVMALIQAWYLALIATALLILMARQADLRHGIQERLTRWVSVPTGSLWSWTLYVAPFVAGFGLVLPAVFFLGMGWWVFRWRERTLFVLLVVSLLATPWVGAQLTRLATPMRPETSTLAALISLETEADTPPGRATFQARAAQDPGDPYLEFGRAWLAHQDGDLLAAEAGYRQALAAWPDDDRVLNDLGHVLVLQGRYPEAIETLKRALSVAPKNATACFNLSQAYTRSYDFQAANAAMARAAQLDFDVVSRYKAQPGFEGSLPLVSQWLSPRRLWRAVAIGTQSGPPAWPPAWRGRPETLGARFVAMVLVMVAAGLGLGAFMVRGLPLHQCSNCSRVVCRRCSVRRRSESLCRSCSHAVAGAESPEFVRMLLARQRQRTERLPRLVRLLAACVVPGLGLALHHKVFRPFLIALLASLGLGLIVSGAPYAAHPRFGGVDSVVPTVLTALAIALAYLVSITGYIAASARADARTAAAARVPRPAAPTRARIEDAPSDVEAA